MEASEAVLNDHLNQEILVLNWESLNTKKIDKETGESVFDNIYMRDGEKYNLQDLWKKTKETGIKIALIIDESHHTAGSETSREIIELIEPAFVIELTATPNFEQHNPDGIYDYHTVNPIEVINAEVIKKSIKLNDTTRMENTEGVLKGLLEQAIFKREELKQAYIDENINYINPLCLIQLPDGEEGNLLKDEVISILHEKGITFSNNKLAIWLSEKENRKNLNNLEELNSPVEYLIFKQAVALGWDCPRAAILVKLRDTKSEIFDLQTIGRILRMPELKYYNNPVLNDSYIYTNADYTLNTGGYPNVLPQRQVLKDEFKDDVLSMKFISEIVKRDNLTIAEKDIIRMFEVIMGNKKNNITSKKIEKLSTRTSNVQIGAFHKKSMTEVKPEDIGEFKYNYSKRDIDRIYKLMVNEIKGNILTYKLVDNLIINCFKSIFTEEVSELKKIILANREIIIEAFDELKKEINKRRFTSINEIEFIFPKDRHATEKKTESLKKCAYEKHFISKYNTEKIFEKFLENREDVLYWIKNGDAGQSALAIAYNDGKEDKNFYPDYIVKFKDNTVGIFEVKDVNDREKETITPKKINALEKYCNKYAYVGGLIQIDGNEVHKSSLPAIFNLN